MRPEFKRSIVAIGAAVVIATLWGAARSVVGQSQTMYEAPRTADGQPDLNGIWQALNTANWNVEDHGAAPAPGPLEELVGAYLAQPAGMSIVEGGTIPYTPEGLAQRQENFETRLNREDPFTAETVADPEAKCYGPAPPRGAYMPFPFQIVQSENAVLIAYEYTGTPRVIHLGEVDPLIFDGVDTWMGQSKGHWEGDTLVVEVTGFSASAWLDRAGNFMTQEATVVERYTPISPYHLMYEATIEDPNVFTRPWTLSLPLYRRIEAGTQLLEFQCVPFTEEFMYGKLKKPV